MSSPPPITTTTTMEEPPTVLESTNRLEPIMIQQDLEGQEMKEEEEEEEVQTTNTTLVSPSPPDEEAPMVVQKAPGAIAVAGPPGSTSALADPNTTTTSLQEEPHDGTNNSTSTNEVPKERAGQPTPNTNTPTPPTTGRTRREMNPKFKDVQETGKWGSISKVEIYIVLVLVILILGGVIAAVVVVVGNKNKNKKGTTNVVPAPPRPTHVPTAAPSAIPKLAQLDMVRTTIGANNVTAVLLSNLSDTLVAYQNLQTDTTASPEDRAMSWLLFADQRDVSTEVVTRWAMAAIYYSLGGDSWLNKTNWLSDTDHVCDWYGSTCDRFKTLQELDLGGNNLVGSIPLEFALLTDLQALWLRNNHLTGTVPGTVFGSMPKLTILYMENNALKGTIPSTLRNNGVLRTCIVINHPYHHQSSSPLFSHTICTVCFVCYCVNMNVNVNMNGKISCRLYIYIFKKHCIFKRIN